MLLVKYKTYNTTMSCFVLFFCHQLTRMTFRDNLSSFKKEQKGLYIVTFLFCFQSAKSCKKCKCFSKGLASVCPKPANIGLKLYSS